MIRKRYIPRNLMFPDELIFFKKLKEGLKGLEIFPQVSMNCVINVANQKNISERYPFMSKVIDYVVCTTSCEIIAILELDGESHDPPEQKKDDEIRDNILKEAGYIVIRYDKRRPVTPAELNADFKKILNSWNIIREREKMKKAEKRILRELAADS